MFKGLVSSNRCIVPASYYFEWKEDAFGKDKYKINNPNSNIYMAGLYNAVTNKDNKQLSLFDTSIDIYYTIITRSANSSLSNIHNRMPLVFNNDEMQAWLNGQDTKKLVKADHIMFGEVVK